jgi:uncharacterized protein with NRDE domain
MCLVLVALDSLPDYSLIVAANRDEFYDRPTAPAAFWPEAPSVLAGRDLQAGGTWLGIDSAGRFGAVTNYRQGQREDNAPRSRGHLVSEYLTSNWSALEHVKRVEGEAGLYNGFNLLVGSPRELLYFSNREGRVRRLVPGVYGLSNHLLDTPWPKVAQTKSAFGALLNRGGSQLTAGLFDLLLSSAFIVSESFGTRCSTVVLAARDGRVVLVEQSFGPGAVSEGEARYEFQIVTSPAGR